MLNNLNKSPKAFRLMEQKLNSDLLLMLIPSSHHDAKPFVGCSFSYVNLNNFHL
jgi:hypothetical protein